MFGLIVVLCVWRLKKLYQYLLGVLERLLLRLKIMKFKFGPWFVKIAA